MRTSTKTKISESSKPAKNKIGAGAIRNLCLALGFSTTDLSPVTKLFIVFSLLVLLNGCALYTAIDTPKMRDRFPPTGNFITVDGVKLHYLKIEPTEPTSNANGHVDKWPLIMIHGAGGNLQDLSTSIAPELAQDRTVIIFDRPGFGYSERPGGKWFNPADQARVIHGAVKQLGFDKVVVLGHSYGGTVTLRFALDFPETTAAMISIAGPSHHWGGDIGALYNIGNTPVVGPLFAWNVYYPVGKVAIDGAVRKVFSPNPMPENYVQDSASALALRPKTYLANARDVGNLDAFLKQQESRYNELRMPVLLIWGSEDLTVWEDFHIPRFEKQVAQMQRLHLPGAGHMPHHSHSEEVIDGVRQFLEPIN